MLTPFLASISTDASEIWPDAKLVYSATLFQERCRKARLCAPGTERIPNQGSRIPIMEQTCRGKNTRCVLPAQAEKKGIASLDLGSFLFQVVLLEYDVLALQSLDELFFLPAPAAALVRPVSGRRVLTKVSKQKDKTKLVINTWYYSFPSCDFLFAIKHKNLVNGNLHHKKDNT